MATRAIVPRGNGEGSIGTSAKRWGAVYTDEINEKPTDDLVTQQDLGYRQPSTAYTAGEIAYHASLPTGYYLECTTAGTTESGALTISTTDIGTTVSDGDVTWTISRALPISGGTFVASDEDLFIHLNDTSKAIFMYAAPDTNGASLQLSGKNRGSGTNTGAFALKANDGSNNAALIGRTNAVLTWAGNDLAGSAIVAKSLGSNGYIKYASGLIIQWGKVALPASGNDGDFTFPISFSAEPSITAAWRSTGYASTTIAIYAGTNGFSVHAQPSFNGFTCYWQAIGY